jgi:hypothetical protein
MTSWRTRLAFARIQFLGLIHPLFHKGATGRNRLRFGSGVNCLVCRYVWSWTAPHIRDEPFRDESRIEVSKPVLDADGKVIKRGIVMSATVKRQLEEILAKDPEGAKRVQEAIEHIAEDDLL